MMMRIKVSLGIRLAPGSLSRPGSSYPRIVVINIEFMFQHYYLLSTNIRPPYARATTCHPYAQLPDECCPSITKSVEQSPHACCKAALLPPLWQIHPQQMQRRPGRDQALGSVIDSIVAQLSEILSENQMLP